MSHDFKIHKNIYDHSVTITDITKVSKHLEGSVKGRSVVISERQQSSLFKNSMLKNRDFHECDRDEEEFNKKNDEKSDTGCV